MLCPVLPGRFEESVFSDYTLGCTAAKDDWVYDFEQSSLKQKIIYYISTYNHLLKKCKKLQISLTDLPNWVSKKIKWSDTPMKSLYRSQKIVYDPNCIVPTLYRPFVQKLQYYADIITERPRIFRQLFHDGQQNSLIGFPNPSTNVKFNVIGTNLMTDLGCVNIIQNIPLWRYDDNGKATHNITEYGWRLFKKHYKKHGIKKEDVFYYTYAVFNDPKYEEVYRHNLRRQFPQIPLVDKNFERWSTIGHELFNLHSKFGEVEEYNLQRADKKTTRNTPKLSFKRGKNAIRIVIDDATTLEGIPLDVLEWTFKSKTPLEIILDYYKESKNRIKPESCNDKKIRDKFSTYRFRDHKEEVIELLKRVTTVCVETVRLRNELKNMEWGPQPDLKLTPIKKPAKKSPGKTSKSKTARKPRRAPAFKPGSGFAQAKFPL